jgi:lupus La protein
MSISVYKGEDFDEKVRKQVEFYFSDSNLQTDKFLWKIYEANDGWVELKTILTFSRMRQYRPEDKVINALKQSDKLVLSSNEDMIRRSEPLKDFNEIKNNRKRNTVHIEGFPKDISQEDMEAWFNTHIVPNLPQDKEIASIRRIKSRAKREFFGVVDVEFKSQKDTEYILNDIELSYSKGIVSKTDEESDKKDFLKKMSLLTFQEMRESGKRFGVNEVTKRRNSFNDNKDRKFKKGKKFNHKGNKSDSAVDEEPADETVESESNKKETVESESDKKETVDPESDPKSSTESVQTNQAPVENKTTLEPVVEPISEASA